MGPILSQVPLLLGESPALIQLRNEIDMAARTNAKVLILGETGVGKELVARLVHSQGERHARAFIVMNCSGVPETLLASELFGHTRGSFTGAYRDKLGVIRQANRGTLFLDELGEMSLAMQAMLLRFAESGEIEPVGADAPVGRVDVRMITATNCDLAKMVAKGRFREDLYYRLNVIRIRVPPLRERGADVELLFRHYLQHASKAYANRCPDLAPEATELLLRYAWPGNVRELRNMTERLVLRDFRRPIAAGDLPLEILENTQASARAADAAGARQAPETQPAVARERSGSSAPSATVDRLWEQLMAGGDFWQVVQEPFKAREMTRADLAALIDRGLRETRGNYRILVKMVNLPASHYKRFHAFLYSQKCNLPVRPYRTGNADGQLPVMRSSSDSFV